MPPGPRLQALALFANGQAISAFTVTQIAAATAGLAWIIVEWLHRGKPTGLGFALRAHDGSRVRLADLVIVRPG